MARSRSLIKKNSVFPVLALVAIVVVGYWLYKHMTTEHFAAAPDTFKVIYVSSPTCGYCKQFDPIWQKFADQVSKAGLPNVSTVKSVDATAYKVNAFPAVLLYVNDKPKATFDGPRTPEDLWAFLRKNMV